MDNDSPPRAIGHAPAPSPPPPTLTATHRPQDHPRYEDNPDDQELSVPGAHGGTVPDTIERLTNPREGNRYAYAADNPVNHVDPTGQSLEDYASACIVGGYEAVLVGSITGVSLNPPPGLRLRLR